jgi:hypothetical protein
VVEEKLARQDGTPLPESQRIAGLIVVYDERIDVTVDGVRGVHPPARQRRSARGRRSPRGRGRREQDECRRLETDHPGR